MGNAESVGAEHMFDGKSEYDVVCLGLQESTYGDPLCVQNETKKFAMALGEEYYLVRAPLVHGLLLHYEL